MDGAELERRLAGALALREEVLEAYLFGSRAAGRAQAHSDVDIAVFVDESALRRQDYGYAAQLTAHLMTSDADLDDFSGQCERQLAPLSPALAVPESVG